MLVSGIGIRFLPGTYIIKGPLEFSENAQAAGKGVTFVLQDGGSLNINKGAQLDLTAPSTGDYAGLVFYQVPTKGNPKLPEAISEIKSSGGLNMVGAAYFPTQELQITSDKSVASQSPATSFIAYRMKFGGKSNMRVNVDHERGGIPPLLPRSDDGARLIK